MGNILTPLNILIMLLIVVVIIAALIIAQPLRRTAKASEDQGDLVHDKCVELQGYIKALQGRVHELERHVGFLLRVVAPDRLPQALPAAPRGEWGGRPDTGEQARWDQTSGGGAYSDDTRRDVTGELVGGLPQRIAAPPFDRTNPDEIARFMHSELPVDANHMQTAWFDDAHPDEDNFRGGTWFQYIRALMTNRYEFYMDDRLVEQVRAVIASWGEHP